MVNSAPDWTGRRDVLVQRFALNENKWATTRYFLFENNSAQTLSRVTMSPWSLRDLVSLEVVARRLESRELAEAIDMLREPDITLTTSAYVSAWSDWMKRLVSAGQIGARVGRATWTANPGTLTDVIQNGAVKIYAAPSPRIEEIPGGIGPGQALLIIVRAEANIPRPEGLNALTPLVTLYQYGAEVAVLSIEIVGNTVFCSGPIAAMIHAQSGVTRLPSEATQIKDNVLTLRTQLLPRDSKIHLPFLIEGNC